MTQLRIVIKPLADPTAELRLAADIRRDLYAHSPVELDPDNRVHGTHRREDRRAYFEFATNRIDDVDRVLGQYGYKDRVDVEQVAPHGTPCVNCGNVSGAMQPAVCPTCGFREVTPCPRCGREMPRESYVQESGNLYRCANCHSRVRSHFHDPLFDDDGNYCQPLIRIEPADVA